MKTVCSECSHRVVCKNIERLDELKLKINSIIEEDNYPFNVNITCPNETGIHTKIIMQNGIPTGIQTES